MSDGQSDGNSSSSDSDDSRRDPFDEPTEDINQEDTSIFNLVDPEAMQDHQEAND